MELWFVLAVASAVAGGIFIFITKVAAERNYDIVLLSTLSVIFSGIIYLVITVLYSDFSDINSYVLLLILFNSVGYMAVNVLRHNAMRCIDTAIYYPIYKTLTPAIAILAGIFFFSERFTSLEWFGLGLSLAVPLLLISHAEKARQNDLFRGLKLLVYAAVLASLAAVAIKEATSSTENIWFFLTLTEFSLAFVGVMLLLFRNNKKPITVRLKAVKNKQFVWLTFWMVISQALSFGALVFAFDLGPLGIVYTINSLYILIPIILSIIFYNEHWNAKKVVAIILSVAALALLK